MRSRRRWPAFALGALVAAALAPAAAEARPPRISAPPVISGTPEVGRTLVAEGATWEPRGRGTTATWQWLRCDDTDRQTCREIPGATTTSYAVGQADLGKRLRVLLYVSNRDGWAWWLTATTAAVTAPAGPDPGPSPSPSPSPLPSPSPSPSPGPGGPAAPATPVAPTTPAVQTPAPGGGVLDRQARAPRMMRPAPIVRIRGRLTRSGARITLLTVRAPRGARIAVRCLGRGCPARRWAGIASLTRIARFEGVFRAGTRLVVTVAKRGRIGKHTTITFRRGAAPRRRDRCLLPDARKPVRCPRA